MNEEAGFIAALVADPSDQTTALVFADWLEERGDPRGPMMRNEELRALLAPTYKNPIPKLRADIEAGKKVTEAGKTLARIGEPAVPELVPLLAHQVGIVRLRAMKVLSLMGGNARSAIPALLEVVKGSNKEDKRVRREAVRLLGTLRVKESARDQLAQDLDSTDPAERLTAIEAIAKLDLRTKAVGHSLCKALGDESAPVRRIAAERLRYVASPSMAFAVEPLCKALSDESVEVRSFALVALGKIGPKAASAVPALLQFLTQTPVPTDNEHRSAVQALVDLKTQTPEVLEVLLAALRVPAARQIANQALQSWGTFLPSAVPGLFDLIRNPTPGQPFWNSQVAAPALRALVRVRPRPPEVATELRAQLATNNAPYVAEVLETFGNEAASFLPELVTAFHRSDQQPENAPVKIACVIAKIGGEGITALAKTLDRVPTKADPLPAAAAEGLAIAGANARPVMPELQAQLKRLREQKESFSRLPVIRALAAFGTDAIDSVPDLVAVTLEDTSNQSTSFYIRVLQGFGPAVLPFVPQLVEALRPSVRRLFHAPAVKLLTELIPHGYDALPVLYDTLRTATANYNTAEYVESNSMWREVATAAIEGLTKLGPAAEGAVPDLVLADQTFDYVPFTRSILTALGKMGGSAALAHIRTALVSHWNSTVRVSAVDALAKTGDTSAETRDALRALGDDPDEDIRARVTALLQGM